MLRCCVPNPAYTGMWHPPVSRRIKSLAADALKALSNIGSARALARSTALSIAGERSPDHGIDLDATWRLHIRTRK
jgi:uncharacterized protein (UPF0147 family)